MRINRELETASVQIRQTIDEIVEVDPGGQHTLIKTLVSRGNAKEENLLPRYMNQSPQQFGKQFWQPWATGKYETFCNYFVSGSLLNGVDLFLPGCWRSDRCVDVINAADSCLGHDCLDRASCQQYA